MNPSWQLRTGRLLMGPVGWADLADLVELKGDPRAFAVMLGGVRGPAAVADDLAQDMASWARQGFGLWAVRAVERPRFIGLVGLAERADGRGVGLRFALRPQEQGHGYASEAAGAALRFGHERAGLRRIVGVAREDNFSSRTVLGAIGMRVCETFLRDGVTLLMFESVVE
jgi:RimJ/RimL family protein N-acetyltransferase